MNVGTLYVCCVVAVSLPTNRHIELSWSTLVTLATVIILLSVAVIVTVALVCYYRRRMTSMSGSTMTLLKPWFMTSSNALSLVQNIRAVIIKTGKVLLYSLPSVGPGADSGVQATPLFPCDVNISG